MYSKSFMLLLVMGAFVRCTASFAESMSTSFDYLPLIDGQTREFRGYFGSGTDTVTFKTTKKEKDGIEYYDAGPAGWIRIEDGFVKVLLNPYAVQATEMRRTDFWPIISVDPKVGDVFGYSWGEGFARYTVEGFDTVETPAGTFTRTLKVRLDFIDLEQNGVNTSHRYWYARNIGIVQTEFITTGRVQKLVKCNPGCTL